MEGPGESLGANSADAVQATGHTAQYLSLARALAYAAGAMEDDLEELSDRGTPISMAALNIESRFVTVTLLSSAMIESLANTIIAMASNGTFKPTGKRGLIDRWQKHVPKAIGSEPFLDQDLLRDLKTLGDIRNSITHSNPRLYAGEKVIAHGNTQKWEQLSTETARMIVALPLRLLGAVPRTENYSLPLEVFASDYWLSQAIARGSGRGGRSPNRWRPFPKEYRLRGEWLPPPTK